MTPSYQTIHSFFDAYGFVHARSILQELIKKADSEKSWNRNACCNVLFFTEKLTELIEAVYQIINTYDQQEEAIIGEQAKEDSWQLTNYNTYCVTHRNDTPWDFFPRHLSKKEFLDPYKALEKFTSFRNIDQWKQSIKHLAYYALSSTSINEFDDDKSILRTYIHLNKLIEATHLIEIRIQPATPKYHKKRKPLCPPPAGEVLQPKNFIKWGWR
jgi:hypothetical protein